VGVSRANIDQLVAMGFPEDQVVRALRASFDNRDGAVEYLLNVRATVSPLTLLPS
jgi:uncharacterized UBP type Zn finger protein